MPRGKHHSPPRDLAFPIVVLAMPQGAASEKQERKMLDFTKLNVFGESNRISNRSKVSKRLYLDLLVARLQTPLTNRSPLAALVIMKQYRLP